MQNMDNDRLQKKIRGYHIFSAFYNFRRKFPGKRKGIFFVMTHDKSMNGNCGVMLETLKGAGYKTYALTRKHTSFGWNLFGAVRFFVVKSFQMAKCDTIFLDNTFLPTAFCEIPPSVRVAMLWHGTGTIKKFGLDTTVGPLRDLEEAADKKITHLFVASDYTKSIYSHCFGLPEDRIYVTGNPRCDELFRAHESGEDLREKDKFTVLFATTFREGIPGEAPYYELRALLRKLWTKNRKIQVLLRLHPHVSYELKGRSEFIMFGNCTDVSRVENLNNIMKKADLLVTDYSSVCYDFAILERPILFYAPDLDYYRTEERGFYEDYESFVPGPVIKRMDRLAEEILNIASDPAKPDVSKQEAFMDMAFAFKDSNATERIMEVLEL